MTTEASEVPVANLTESKVLDSLKLLDDSPAEEKQEEESEEEEIKEPSPDDEEESEEDEEETTEEELKLDKADEPLLGVPSRKEVLKAFPDLYKKFPALEKAVYREHQFAEIFPDVSDAKEAAENSKYLSEVRTQLLDGNIGSIFSELSNHSKQSFEKIVEPEALLSTIGKVDNNSRINILSYVLKSALHDASERGKKTNKGEDSPGAQLELAAKILHNYIFNDPEVTGPPASQKKTEDPKETELSKREQELNERDFRRAVDSISSSVQSKIQSEIERVIDPKGQMSAYVKKNAVRELMLELDKTISDDKRFGQGIVRMYDDARKSNYSEESKSKIRRALLSRAQTLLQDGMLRNKRNEVLKDSNKSEVKKPKFKGVADPQRKTSSDKKESGKPKNSSVSSIVDFLGK